MCPLLPLEFFVTSHRRVGFDTVPTPPVTGVAITALITHARKCVKGLNDSSWEFAPLTMERYSCGPRRPIGGAPTWRAKAPLGETLGRLHQGRETLGRPPRGCVLLQVAPLPLHL